jgi:hypothetical protein
MGTVNNWVGAIGGTILVLELIVVLILLVAINLGLALLLRWVLRKRGVVHEKIVWAQALVDRFVNKGAGVAAAPVIRTTSAWRGLKATYRRALHWPKPVAALPPAEKQLQEDPSRAA